MPIPPLQSNFLPIGVHECTIEELVSSPFCSNERRRELVQKLTSYITNLHRVGITGWIILDGSFVTSKELPGDIDIILVLVENQQYSISTPVSQIDQTLLKTEYVKKNFELHLFVGFTDSGSESGLDDIANGMVEFFKGVRNNPTTKKGLLKVKI
jgi:hypothetical protein